MLFRSTPFLYNEPFEKPEERIGGARVNEVFNEFAKCHSTAVVSMPTYDISLRYGETEVWDENPIHPTDKIPLAERAVELFWGLTHENFVPFFGAFKIESGEIIAECANAYGGLATPNNEPIRGFRVWGANRESFPADAIVFCNNKVRLFSAIVPNPTGFSYAFCNMNNEANLFNARGIPVQIFRTD